MMQKFAAFHDDEGIALGVVEGEQLRPIRRDFASGPDPMIDLISRIEEVEQSLPNLLGDPMALNSVSLAAPVRRPGKVWAIALNYQDHIEESGLETPAEQVWFTKAVTSIAGPRDVLQIPAVSAYVDYEAELVAVIGETCKHVSYEDAPSVVFGYCVGNDVTERHWQHRVPQWSLGKSFDTHGPIGPWITRAGDELDPHALDIVCKVNGEVRQSSNTRHLLFDVYRQIEHLSAAMTLEPGDLIFTGTPGGIGAAMDPMVFLQPGDIVSCEIEGLGKIENRFEPEEAPVKGGTANDR
ncbi:fumarylacetoacetate hydrolase family protein [Erythrobacter sp.]|jgi:2-keto-4-pentenoate hydratase/2-oxohepta-3-ene-1,7-dioic acid hydratase in catechol pathway|uniref:fumarylacetoacetate hydrolase family protein n=1 Tax=Erythrobacter sp. TaxID=1042 RepID=UPI002EA2C242|nr:fumarylacetoacetate hydrolase family protein [Erythrobacter sp.]